MKRYHSAEKYIKFVLVVIIAIVFTLCTVFYTLRKDEFDIIPRFTYEPWFVFPVLVISLLGYLYVVMTNKVLALTFAINSTVLLVSVVLLFDFLYFSPRINTTTIQSFSFNIVINTAILMFYVLYNSSHYISGCLALMPMFLMGGYYLYIGHIIA